MKKEFDVKLNKKQIIVLAFSTTFFYALVLYFFNIEDNLKSLAIQALIYGVSMTLFFVFLFPWMMKKLVGKPMDKITPELLENEKVEREIFANLFKGLEAVGGKLFFTNQRFVFKSHSLNIQKGQTSIEFAKIASVSKRKTAKLVDNGIRIITKEGAEYDFVVNDRDNELKKIQQKLTP